MSFLLIIVSFHNKIFKNYKCRWKLYKYKYIIKMIKNKLTRKYPLNNQQTLITQ